MFPMLWVRSSAGKTMCTAPHPGLSVHHLITGKAREGINITRFLQGKPLTVLLALIYIRISPKYPHQISVLLTQM